MNYIKINGTSFDVNVAISKYNENFSVLDGENAGRSKDTGRMIRDVLGTYIGHKVTVFRRGDDYRSYDAFWNYLKAHSIDDSVLLEAADGNTTISYHRTILKKLKTGSIIGEKLKSISSQSHRKSRGKEGVWIIS